MNFRQWRSGSMPGIECGTPRNRIPVTSSFPFGKLEHHDLSTQLFVGTLSKWSLPIGGNFPVNFWTLTVALFRGDGGYRIEIIQSRGWSPISQWNENDSERNNYQWRQYHMRRPIDKVNLNIRDKRTRNRPSKPWGSTFYRRNNFSLEQLNI
jgi:hypothetical protein